MKNIFTFLLVFSLLIPNNIKSQDDGAAAAAIAAGVLAIGSGIAAVEQLKEEMELKAVEQILSSYPEIKNFELKTSTLKGAKMKDISRTGIVTYEINNIGGERLVLFLFLSSGWSNQYGLDFNKVKWKLFDRKSWNDLMQAFVQTASRNEVDVQTVAMSTISAKGLKNNKDYILEFDKMRGDVYYTLDYSDEFKLVFNEGTMGLFLKQRKTNETEFRKGGVTGDLVQIRRKAIDNLSAFNDPSVVIGLLPLLEKKDNYIYYENIIDMIYELGEEKKNAELVRRMAFKAHFSKREHE